MEPNLRNVEVIFNRLRLANAKANIANGEVTVELPFSPQDTVLDY